MDSIGTTLLQFLLKGPPLQVLLRLFLSLIGSLPLPSTKPVSLSPLLKVPLLTYPEFKEPLPP